MDTDRVAGIGRPATFAQVTKLLGDDVAARAGVLHRRSRCGPRMGRRRRRIGWCHHRLHRRGRGDLYIASLAFLLGSPLKLQRRTGLRFSLRSAVLRLRRARRRGRRRRRTSGDRPGDRPTRVRRRAGWCRRRGRAGTLGRHRSGRYRPHIGGRRFCHRRCDRIRIRIRLGHIAAEEGPCRRRHDDDRHHGRRDPHRAARRGIRRARPVGKIDRFPDLAIGIGFRRSGGDGGQRHRRRQCIDAQQRRAALGTLLGARLVQTSAGRARDHQRRRTRCGDQLELPSPTADAGLCLIRIFGAAARADFVHPPIPAYRNPAPRPGQRRA